MVGHDGHDPASVSRRLSHDCRSSLPDELPSFGETMQWRRVRDAENK